jgi:AraC-like DNA-binding protein
MAEIGRSRYLSEGSDARVVNESLRKVVIIVAVLNLAYPSTSCAAGSSGHQEILVGTGMSLVDVALSGGFQTQSHCTSVFKRYAGRNPRAPGASPMASIFGATGDSCGRANQKTDLRSGKSDLRARIKVLPTRGARCPCPTLARRDRAASRRAVGGPKFDARSSNTIS